MRRKRRKKHRRHREVEDEDFDENIISRKRRETFNLDVKLRFKLCEDPNGDPLTPGMSELYFLLPVSTSGFHFRFPLPVEILVESLLSDPKINPKVIFITHHENY